ncbi:hypothetical protein EV356DRAFT_512710 [Viridothelium virens]|uniref:Uncharacterized protein n=1 Tax=Viridothelium virens TaxID=1048519 RepID=A0A6A6GS46_VIRVR|nr:hypothetical protein EV356DRAFT_512710 [Viridothelium virens]
MGRRKKPRKEKVPKPDRPLHCLWPEEAIEELIAFLDYAGAEGFEKAQINESAAEHLSLCCHNGRYSSDQVMRKLHWLRQFFGPQDDRSRDLDRIYIERSSNLTWFNEGQKVKIAKRTSEIRKERGLAHMHSSRTLRSGSKQITESPGLASRLRSESRSTTGLSRGSRGPHGVTIHPPRRRSTTDGVGEYETNPSIDDSRGWPIKAEDTRSLFGSPTRRTVVTVEVPRASVAPAVPILASIPTGTLSLGSRSPQSSEIEEDREFDNENLAAPLTTIRSMTERNKCLERDLDELKRNFALDIDFWKARCHSVELECAEFKRSQDALAVKLEELLRSGGQTTVDEIVQMQSTVDKLQSKLAHRSEIARLMRPGSHSLDNETALWVAKRMGEAYRKLEEIFVTHDADVDWTRLTPQPGSLITPLMHRVVPTGTRSKAEVASALKLLRSQGITQKQFLQALSAAALVEWVFQASTATLTLDRYQGFCAPGTTSAYSKALAHVACKDSDFASNIDLDIHRDIIDEAAFKHFLEGKATDLGWKLQEAFEPLSARQDIADSTSATSDDEPSLGEQLAGVFTKSMEVQCRLRVSGRRFRCTWYSLGQATDPEHMTICGQKHSDAEGQSRVGLTLLPGINEILDETSGVGMSGFVDGCSGREPTACLVPAVVLCRNMP